MNSKKPLLIIYGAVLATGSLLAPKATSEIATTAVWLCGLGGLACVLWGALGLLGYPYRGGATLTLIVIGYVLLTQVVHVWLANEPDQQGTILIPLGMTALLVGSIALLAFLLYTGEDSSAGATGVPPMR